MENYTIEIIEDSTVITVNQDPVIQIVTVKEGPPGIPGKKGDTGISLQFTWNGTQLGIKTTEDAIYQYVDLKGSKGNTGDSLEFAWIGTQLGIRIKGQIDYQYVELKGATGVKGDKPAHQWVNTSLQMQNADGTWGALVNLKGQSGEGTGDMHTSIYDPTQSGVVSESINAQTIQGISPDQIGVFGGEYLYVNAVTGLDTNDGKTGLTAVKTIDRAFTMLSGKSGYVNMHVAAGDYSSEYTSISNFRGSLMIIGADKALTLLPQIVASDITEYFEIRHANVKQLTTTGCLSVNLENLVFNSVGSFYSMNLYNSNVAIDLCTFTNQTTICSADNSVVKFWDEITGSGNNVFLLTKNGAIVTYYKLATAGSITVRNNLGGTFYEIDALNNTQMYVSDIIYTDKGTNPDFVGVKYKLVVVNGMAMMEVVSV